MRRQATYHAMGCGCSRCSPRTPAIRRLSPWNQRAVIVLVGAAIGSAIILLCAACGGPSPLVIIGK